MDKYMIDANDRHGFIEKAVLLIPSWGVKNYYDPKKVLEERGGMLWLNHDSFEYCNMTSPEYDNDSLRFEPKLTVLNNKIYHFGHKIPILKLNVRGHISYRAQKYFHEQELKNKNYKNYYDEYKDKEFDEWFYVLYVNFSTVIKPFYSKIIDGDYNDFLYKEYISEVDFLMLKTNLIKDYLNKIENKRSVEVIREISNSSMGKVCVDCEADIWNDVCATEKEVSILEKDSKKASRPDKKSETVIVFDDWWSLVRYEMLYAIKKNVICNNPSCRRLLGANENSYCINNDDCKRSRTKQRVSDCRVAKKQNKYLL